MIKPIVEGHGEVDALPVLLRRIAWECFNVSNPPLLHPGRYHSSGLIQKKSNTWIIGPALQKAASHASREGASCLLILLDLDDDCPKELYETLQPQLFVNTGFEHVCLVFAKCEYESWFLASAETLGDNVSPYPNDPEDKRDAKGALESYLRLKFPYSETVDQPRYSSKIDIWKVYNTCRSFRKLVKEFRNLLQFLNCNPAEWPTTTNDGLPH